jgi:hypothetical protein
LIGSTGRIEDSKKVHTISSSKLTTFRGFDVNRPTTGESNILDSIFKKKVKLPVISRGKNLALANEKA